MSHGYISRYPVEDGLKGDEGAWLMTTFWWVDALVGLNRLDEAQDLMNKLVATCNHVGLMTEEVDPNTGYLLGNLPQAYSHLGLINSALRLERASAP